ncbi:zinc metalloproteinase nas-6-like [Paramacrobiotus metropolitanus]|uniref:zinc metalloproteinase nas-6-like n=1 Tax=Paramacrobiotus metropolitanus TaxID=2943436 RepID=UPI0024456D25|nr:zinc metalloproteinase nas-6-like [Paramacrobiotus metropolitanus]
MLPRIVFIYPSLIIGILAVLLVADRDIDTEFKNADMEWCKLVPEGTFPECKDGASSAPSVPTVVDPEFHFIGTAQLPPDKVLTAAGSFEGDILGYDPGMMESTDTLKQQSKNFITDEAKKWPKGVVPIKVSPYFRPLDGSAIRKALETFTAKTGIQFVERTTEGDYVYIGPGVGCQSFTGRQGGRQQLSLQIPGCKGEGIIHHELMHLMGFYHEQSRTDRDDYVEINWSNIAPENVPQFQKYSAQEITAFGEPYDFGSILHYGKFDFAKDPKVFTIQPRPGKLPPGVVPEIMGQRDGMSRVDLLKMKLAYPKMDNRCPTEEPGWLKLGEKKCYYFSFIAKKRASQFVEARNYCRVYNAAPASEAKNGLRYIHSIMDEHANQVTAKDLVWIVNCKTLSSTTSDAAFSECIADEAPRFFVCYKKMDPNDAS